MSQSAETISYAYLDGACGDDLNLRADVDALLAADAQGAGRWRYLRFKDHGPRRTISVVWRKGRTRPVLAERFAAIIEEHLAPSKRAAVISRGERNGSPSVCSTEPAGERPVRIQKRGLNGRPRPSGSRSLKEHHVP